MALEIHEIDFDDPAQTEALCEILDAYAREPGGQSAPLSATNRWPVPGCTATPHGL